MQTYNVALVVLLSFTGRAYGLATIDFRESTKLVANTSTLNQHDKPIQEDVWSQVRGHIVGGWSAAHHLTAKTDLSGKQTHHLFSAAPWSEWLVLMCTVVVLVILDAFVISPFRDSAKESFTRCSLVVLFWVIVAVAYSLYYGARFGVKYGIEFWSGYFLEMILSMDNLFVFLLIFKGLKTPESVRPRALMIGIAGGVFMKAMFFLCVGSVLKEMMWARLVFGILLIYSGVMSAFEDDDDDDDDDDQDLSESSRTVRVMSWLLGSRLKAGYDEEGRCFVREDGKMKVTLLFLVILYLQISDVVFAVDSVSAKVSQLSNVYTAYSSTVLALFSLRAMYFVLEHLVHIVDTLKYGISAVLVFIGVELCLSPWVAIAPAYDFAIIIGLLALSVLASQVKSMILKRSEKGTDDDPQEILKGSAQ